MAPNPWPSIPYSEWKESLATLHLWTQIVGKVRLVQTPWINHSWHATFYVTSRGLTTSLIPYGVRSFQIDFDFVLHQLSIKTTEGKIETVLLSPKSVSEFYHEFFQKLHALDLSVKIYPSPNEIPDPIIPFHQDRTHASYDFDSVHRFWRALMQTARVFQEFRSRFIGKCSPVHFFWGGPDLAVTRFSGRRAPEHPGGIPHLPDWVTREAYSHEVSSCGFWPGGELMPEPMFYSYAYPEPNGFRSSPISPFGAIYHPDLKEFVLPYEAVRQSSTPDETLLEFLQSSYEAAANSGQWSRSELERR